MCQRREPPMRKIREILRLKWTLQLSNREIAQSCSTARSTVAGCLQRASNVALSWPLPEDLDDAALELLCTPMLSLPRQSGRCRSGPWCKKR